MKRNTSRIWAPVFAEIIFCGLVSAVILCGRRIETAEPSDTAAENYAIMSKNEYIDWLLSELTDEEKCAILEGAPELAADSEWPVGRG